MITRLLLPYCLLFVFSIAGSSNLAAQLEAEENGTIEAEGDGAQPFDKKCAVEGTAVINEVGNYSDPKFNRFGEFIELVVVGENPSLPVNLAGFIIDDNHSSVSADGSTRGHIRLGDCFSEVMPGTIILLYDDTNIFPGVNVQNDGAPNANGVYQIPFENSCLTLVSACPVDANTSYSCSAGGYGGSQDYWNKYIKLNDNIDVVQVRNSKLQLEHAVMWWPNSGNMSHFPDENSAKAVKVSESSVSNISISFKDTDPHDAANYHLTYQFTPGWANDSLNQEYIDALKPIVCVGETISLGCDGNEDYCYGWAPAGIVSFGKGGEAFITPTQDTVVRRTTIDANGDIVAENTYFIRTHPEFTVAIAEEQLGEADCPAEADFRFTATVSAEYPEYTFAWPDGNSSGTVVLAGGHTYNLTVTPPNGCAQVVPVTAQGDPSMLASVNINTTRSSICGDDPVQLTAALQNYSGASNYTYQWSNGASTSVSDAYLAGEYRVTVTSEGGCVFTDTIMLEETFEASIAASGIQACSENPITLTAETYGNDEFYFTYEWSTGEFSSTITVVDGGVYTVTITNDEGCSISDLIEIDAGVTLQVEAETDRLVPGEFVAITPTVSGGTPPYAYQWSSGATSTHLSVNVDGTYSVTVTDAFNCQDEGFVTILPFDESLCEGLDVSVLFHEPDCENYGRARLESVASSGLDAATYAWSNGKTTEDILINQGGTEYAVTVTSANGCQVVETIQVPDFNTLSSLTVVGDICQLVDNLNIVSLADDQAILVMENLTEEALNGIMANYPNLSVEVLAVYEGTNERVEAVVPLASPGNIPDPTIWAGDLFDIPAETSVGVSIQITGLDCPGICPDSRVLNNFGAVDSVEVVLEENPEIRLTDYDCGDTFVAGDETANEEPLFSLNVGDVITVNGFPLLVSSLQGGSTGTANSNGIYTGEGIVPLPFNDRTVRVSFTESFINENRVLKTGSVVGLQASVSNFDFSMDSLIIGGDICIPPVNEDGFTEDGINPVTGLDRFGFVDSTGLHSVTGTMWDENGFDAQGNHRETGGPYNEQGCNREGRNEAGGECTPMAFIDSTAQVFIDSVNVLLDNLADAEMQRQEDVAAAALQAKQQECGVFRTDITNLIQTLEFQSEFIVGDTGQYLKPGMSENFASKPEVFPTSDPTRNPQVVQLEAKHVDLYECDVVELLLSDTLAVYQGADAGALKDYLILQLSYLSADDINALKVGDAFSSWIAEKTADYLLSLVPNDQEVGSLSSPANFESPTQPFYNMGTYANADESVYFGSREEMIAYELNAQFNQGFEMIQGVHRAHFLAKLVELQEDDEESNGVLPIAVTKYIGGIEYSILLDQMSFNPLTGGATLSAYLIIEDPESGQKLVFQATNVSFGVGGAASTRLDLASTVAIRINNASKLILEPNRTFAEWDCQGFVGAGIGGKVEMCRDFITPLHEETLEPLPDSVRFAVNFEAYVTEWLDAVVSVDAGAFAVTKHENVKWQLDSAIVDLSDHYTPEFVPTEGYSSQHYTRNEGFSPLWRGFYMQNLSATLPNQFSSSETPITIGVEDVLIDKSGFTGEAYVEGVNILGMDDGSAGGWPFSIDRFNVKVLHNSFAGAGFGGAVIVPVFKETMRYDARIYSENRFKFTVQPDSILTMDLLLAKATLHEASKIEIGYDTDGFLAVADLTGDIKFEIPTDASVDMKLPELYFKEFRVSNRDPYFDSGVWEIRNLGLSMDFGGFGMDLSKISPYRGETSREMGLGFDLAISLGGADLDLTAGGSFGILGELEEINERQKWKFKRIDLNGLFIDANIKDVVHIKGGLKWYKDHPQYGKGFQGLLSAEFTKEPLDFSATVAGQFGKFEGTKYFFVDAMVGLGSGIPIGPLNINGFGGGVSYHMDSQMDVANTSFGNSEPSSVLPMIGKSFSGAIYTVAPEIGIGLKASVMVATQKKELFNGWAALEFIFNDSDYGGGLARVSFKGQGQFMSGILETPPAFLDALSANLDAALPIDQVPTLGKPNPVPLSAWIDLTYNFNDNVFDGKLEAYLNAGIIKGAGTNNALVQAAMHVSDEKWYFNVGTPTSPAGILVDMPFFNAGATAYFNMGTDIPDFPGLPSNVASMAGLYNTNEGLRKSGGGVMFGARMYSNVDLNLGPVRGFLHADLGFDLMLRDYGDAICRATQRPIGLNGWYASGQAWLYLNGGVKILGVSVAEFGLAGVMQARLPNPFWAKATLAAEVKLLFIKKRVNFNVEIGERCEFQDENGEALPENPIINYLDPLKNARDVAPNVAPQIYFNYSIGEAFTDENGDEYTTRIKDLSMRTLRGGYALSYDESWSNANTTLVLQPHRFFTSNDSIRVSVTVEVKKGNTVERTETQEIVFNTAAAYDYIPVTNVAYSYPVDGMYDFYPEEYNRKRGFVQLITGQAEILTNLENGEQNKVLLESAGGQRRFISLEYDILNRLITFPMEPSSLTGGANYRLTIVRTDSKNNVTKELLAPLHFRVSNFARFSGKVAAINSSPAINGPSIAGLGDFSRRLDEEAYLGDAARLGIGQLAPLVRMTADLNSSYMGDLDDLVNGRFPQQACGTISYAEEAQFENLRDAAGVSAYGSNQTLVVGANHFNGEALDLNLNQEVSYLAVKETYNRYIGLRAEVGTCVFMQEELYEDAFGGDGDLNINLTVEQYLRQQLSAEIVDFHYSTFPAAPGNINYKINVSYVLPNRVTTSNGTIQVPK